MGNKVFESKPIAIGKATKAPQEAQEYFKRINTILHDNYINNLYSDKNLEVSLDRKSFEHDPRSQNQIEDISWLDNIYNYLQSKNSKNTNNIPWITELENALSKELFLYENRYISDFFYMEYKFNTCPEVLDEDNNNDYNLDLENVQMVELAENQIVNDNEYNELDITENLGGSYIEKIPTDNTEKIYQMQRNECKKYVKIFKSHIYNNLSHPINRVVVLFNRFFCKYIRNKMKDFEKEIKGQILIGDYYNNMIKEFEKEITDSLREFILTVHISLKLFYSTCIDYNCFMQEKDDLLNLVICLFFKTGKLYETIFDLYSLSYTNEIQQLQDKLNYLKNVKPKEIGLQVKFCLDEDTMELQRTILEEKQKERDKIDNEQNKDTVANDTKIKKNLDLFQIKEGDEEEKENDDDDKPIKIDKNQNDNIIDTNTKDDITTNDNKNKNITTDNKEDDYLLAKIKISDEEEDGLSQFKEHIRHTLNTFNNQKYLFPKITKNLRDTLALKDKQIIEAKESGKVCMPYYSAISLLRNIKKYKTPFEKVVILAAISDQITYSVNEFWANMIKYIKKSFLLTEVDELMGIFAYIVIRAQMPDILVELNIISNFTTNLTKAFSLSYNLTLLQASLETIKNMDKTKEGDIREKQLKNMRKSIIFYTNQRLSRLSRTSQSKFG